MAVLCEDCEHRTDVTPWGHGEVYFPEEHVYDFRCKLPPFKVGGNGASKKDFLAPCGDNNKDGRCAKFSRRPKPKSFWGWLCGS